MNVNDGSEVCPTCHGGVPHGTIKLHAEINRLRATIIAGGARLDVEQALLRQTLPPVPPNSEENGT